MSKGLDFDPGFGPYIMAFQGTVEYLYNDVNRFKNFSQKKMKFRQYHKKILEVFKNNLGFYAGCLMWAAFINKQEEQPILNNFCLGRVYDETENTAETDFMIQFVELFPKDMNYFLGEKFEFDKNVSKILELYRDFIVINKGFVDTKNSTDIKLPQKMKVGDIEEYKKEIDGAISAGDLSILTDKL